MFYICKLKIYDHYYSLTPLFSAKGALQFESSSLLEILLVAHVLAVSSGMMHGRGRGRGRGGGGPPMFHGGMPPGDDPRAIDKSVRSIFGKGKLNPIVVFPCTK